MDHFFVPRVPYKPCPPSGQNAPYGIAARFSYDPPAALNINDVMSYGKTNQETPISSNSNSTIRSADNSFHSLVPLESTYLHQKRAYPSTTYRAVHTSTGADWCIRRLHDPRVNAIKCRALGNLWKEVRHTNCVQLKEVYITDCFNDESVIVAYDFHPESQTFLNKYFTTNSCGRANGPLLYEEDMWKIVSQLLGGLLAIHSAGLACRSLNPTKIIVSADDIIRYSFVGNLDITASGINPNELFPPNYSDYQQEDLMSLGKLILALACGSISSLHENRIYESLQYVNKTYSKDFRLLLSFLLTSAYQVIGDRTILDLMPLFESRYKKSVLACKWQIFSKLHANDLYLLHKFRDYIYHLFSDVQMSYEKKMEIVLSIRVTDMYVYFGLQS